MKEATLSERLSIEQENPSVKKFHNVRCRLISINASDYFLKLKQLLLNSDCSHEKVKEQREELFDHILAEIRTFKRELTPVLFKDKVLHSPKTTKRLSSDDDDEDEEEEEEEEEEEDEEQTQERQKCLRIGTKKAKTNDSTSLSTTQFGIFIQCTGPVSCNIFSTNETVSSTTTTTTTTSSDSDSGFKSSLGKTSLDTEQSSRTFVDKQSQQQQFNPVDSSSTSTSETCSTSSTVMNMSIKRRILASYNSDPGDKTSSTNTPTSISRPSRLRHFYRSKSFCGLGDLPKKFPSRSSSLPPRIYDRKNKITLTRSSSTSKSSKMSVHSKAEPIDLTDESSAMPKIVDVEENVELVQQRQRMKNLKSLASSTMLCRPSSNHSSPVYSTATTASASATTSTAASTTTATNTTKSTSLHHPIPTSYYPNPSYLTYHQDYYKYSDPSLNSSSIPNSYPYSSMNTGMYSYAYPGATQYPMMKKSKEPSMPNTYDSRIHSASPTSVTPTSNPNNHSVPPSVVMPIVRKPNYYHGLTPEQQASIKMQAPSPSTAPCRLACCFPSPVVQHLNEKSLQNERMIYRQYTVNPSSIKRDPSQTSDPVHGSSPVSRKQRRVESTPHSPFPYPSYQTPKTYFAPPPPPSTSSSVPATPPWPGNPPSNPQSQMKTAVRYPYPSVGNNPVPNGVPRKMEPYPQPRRSAPTPARMPVTTTPFVPQSSSTLISPPNTPHDVTLANVRTRSIDLQRAIIERGYCDLDKIPKLVVRHTKTFAQKSIDTMGQLFPTWFNEPDYRCIHCFRCDQVFTPQQFMTHIDDEQMQNEQPTNMTSIELLTSEKMSEFKVSLWNQFCTNLTVYAKEGRIGGFSTNRNV